MAGVAGTGAVAGATPLDAPAHRSPGSGDQGGAPEFAAPPSSPDGPLASRSDGRSSPSPSGDRSSSASPTSGTRTPTRTATPSPSPSETDRAVRLHVAITGVRLKTHGTGVRYAVRVRATGGTAGHATAAVAVRPHGTGGASPDACHGTATVRCHLGDLRTGRTLTFRRHVGHAHRVRIDVTVDAPNSRAAAATTVLVIHRSTRHPAPRTGHRHPARPRTVLVQRPLPPVNPPAPVTPALPAIPAAPSSTMVATPPDAGLTGPGARNPADRSRPRLPAVAPRPGPQPTPNGAPVTVRPVADGQSRAGDAAGVPARTILGLLAAAASFVGVVTASVLIRRRNE